MPIGNERIKIVLKLVVVALVATVDAQEVSGDGATDVASAMVEIRGLSAALAEYPEHSQDVKELNSILSEFEQSAAELAALESGVQERGPALSAPQIGGRIAVQSSRASQLEQRMRTARYERVEAVLDDNIESAKSTYEDAREQYTRALGILRQHMERQSQAAQRLAN